jgi:hypothetical protein
MISYTLRPLHPESAPDRHRIRGLVVPWDVLDAVEKRKISFPRYCSAVQSVAISTELPRFQNSLVELVMVTFLL